MSKDQAMHGAVELWANTLVRKDKRIATLEARAKALQAFAQDIMSNWPEGDIDGGDLQEIAVKHGLLKPVMMDRPCSEDCHCQEFYSSAEWPVECFRKTDLLSSEERE